MTGREIAALCVFVAALVALMAIGARGDLVDVMTEIEAWIGGRP